MTTAFESAAADILEPSICKAAFDQLGSDSVAAVIARDTLEIRDFVLLSFVCDQGCLNVERLVDTVGISYRSVICCVEKLDSIGLVQRSKTASELEIVCGTTAGKSYVSKAHTMSA